jgi:hypothetical protein
VFGVDDDRRRRRDGSMMIKMIYILVGYALRQNIAGKHASAYSVYPVDSGTRSN